MRAPTHGVHPQQEAPLFWVEEVLEQEEDQHGDPIYRVRWSTQEETWEEPEHVQGLEIFEAFKQRQGQESPPVVHRAEGGRTPPKRRMTNNSPPGECSQPLGTYKASL